MCDPGVTSSARGIQRWHLNCRKIWLLPIVLLVFSNFVYGEKKVSICHFPQGNPANQQTISVGEPTLPAHLAHGDLIGACTTGCPSSCDDGNLCTSDSCGADGKCVNTPVSCDDGLTCTLDVCDPDVGCLRLPNDGLLCNDGNDCTRDDECAGTLCLGTAIAGCCVGNANCDDSDPCTDDTCFLGSCTNTTRNCAVDNKCLAGFCNVNSNGACETTEVTCDDSNVCTDDACDPVTGCTHVVTTTPPEAVEVSCTDGADNDCDGAIDGNDPDCPVCGNGILEQGEECDDGNVNPFDGCDQCHIVDITPD